MIKTIKVKKQLRLDELIKYAFDNNITEKHFGSNNGALVVFKKDGSFKLDENFHVKPDSIFTFEVDEEITKDTVFDVLVVLEECYEDLNLDHYHNARINDVFDDEDTWKIYALIDNDLELIWDKE